MYTIRYFVYFQKKFEIELCRMHFVNFLNLASKKVTKFYLVEVYSYQNKLL